MRANNFCACAVECPVAGSFPTLGVCCAAANGVKQESRPATASQFQTRIGLGFLIGASLGRCSVLGQPCPVACLRSRRFNFPTCRAQRSKHSAKSRTARPTSREELHSGEEVESKNRDGSRRQESTRETKRTSTCPGPCHARLSRSERHHGKQNSRDNPGNPATRRWGCQADSPSSQKNCSPRPGATPAEQSRAIAHEALVESRLYGHQESSRDAPSLPFARHSIFVPRAARIAHREHGRESSCDQRAEARPARSG